MTKKTFSAVLERLEGTGTWTYLTVPFSVPETFGGAKGQVRVKGTINGLAYRSTLLARGDGAHYLVVNKGIRDQIGVSLGSRVRVVMEPDTARRTVALPQDFARALSRNRPAKAAFARLPHSHQKKYVQWIEDARRAETRSCRIEEALARIVKAPK